MCWNMEASFAVAALGMAGTALLVKRKEHPFLYLTVFYFALMELLQAFTYLYIGQCASHENQILTLLGAYHISFQPIFVVLISLYFVPEGFRQRVQYPAIFFAACCSVVQLVGYYPFQWANHATDAMIYGKDLCANHGLWHISWYVPTFDSMSSVIGYSPRVSPYMLGTIVIPLLLGSWRFTAVNYTFGFLIAYLTTSSQNEAAAVWCLLSFAYLMICSETHIRNLIHVKTWYGLPYPWTKQS
jgi:hypothetical protein